MDESLLTFFAKKNEESSYNALYHFLDAGIMTKTLLLKQNERFREHLYNSISEDTTTAQNFITFLSAIHDIGKITPAFQYNKMCYKNDTFLNTKSSCDDHRKTSYSIIKRFFCCEHALSYEFSSYAIISASHHGVIISDEIHLVGDEKWKNAQNELLKMLMTVFKLENFKTIKLPSIETCYTLMGLITLSDWLVSNTVLFPPVFSLGNTERESQAEKIIEKLHLNNISTNEKSFYDIFSFHKKPFQDDVEEIASQTDKPFIAFLEVPTGMGKTEAALNLYSKIAKKHRGLYYALPTMATSNAMYTRVKKYLENVVNNNAELHLLHSSSSLNKDYETDDESMIIASQWFKEGQKRTLLANFGVGTIDQLLLMVLQVKHFFLKHFAIAGKVVIIDEVHAYDTFMSTHLELAISYLSKLNCSVILLSATLPKNKRESLIKSYANNCDKIDIQYPAIYSIDSSGKCFIKNNIECEKSTILIKRVTITDKYEQIKGILNDKLTEFGIVSCIMNTVSSSQELYHYLKKSFNDVNIILFHSRFTLEDKSEKADLIQKLTGKGSKRDERLIVISTQLLEQSLDVDFDTMITDIAPIDLLIQRAGRVHRHNNIRPSKMQAKELYILIPDLSINEPNFEKNKYIYSPDILLKTSSLFLNDYLINVPDDIQKLIDYVYSDNKKLPNELKHCEDILEKWKDSTTRDDFVNNMIAKANEISNPNNCSIDNVLDYLEGFLNIVYNDEIVSTRLKRLTSNIVIITDGENFEEETSYYFSKSIAISNIYVLKHLYNNIQNYKPAKWSKNSILRNYFAISDNDKNFEIQYSNEFGLMIKLSGG